MAATGRTLRVTGTRSKGDGPERECRGAKPFCRGLGCPQDRKKSPKTEGFRGFTTPVGDQSDLLEIATSLAWWLAPRNDR